MVTPELVSYIWSERKKGVSDYIIKMNLQSQGWSEHDFYEAAATLPPKDTKPGDMLADKHTGLDVRSLGQESVWRTPEGTADLPLRPLRKSHKTLIEILILVLLSAILAYILYAYWSTISANAADYYYLAEPSIRKGIKVTRMAFGMTD